MNTRRLTVAVATTALVMSVPLTTVYGGPAVAAQHHSAGPAVAVSVRSGGATSRLSGLAGGGAAAYNAEVDGTPPTNATAIAYSERAARAAATSRLSGLAEGGAAAWS
ncbi:MAG TPA: hypothetical protein VMS00_06130 [Acidimicrobiales bacterium]|nr:hypothetical protein [Acidimicrobiales bacterium]